MEEIEAKKSQLTANVHITQLIEVEAFEIGPGQLHNSHVLGIFLAAQGNVEALEAGWPHNISPNPGQYKYYIERERGY